MKTCNGSYCQHKTIGSGSAFPGCNYFGYCAYAMPNDNRGYSFISNNSLKLIITCPSCGKLTEFCIEGKHENH